MLIEPICGARADSVSIYQSHLDAAKIKSLAKLSNLVIQSVSIDPNELRWYEVAIARDATSIYGRWRMWCLELDCVDINGCQQLGTG